MGGFFLQLHVRIARMKGDDFLYMINFATIVFPVSDWSLSSTTAGKCSSFQFSVYGKLRGPISSGNSIRNIIRPLRKTISDHLKRLFSTNQQVQRKYTKERTIDSRPRHPHFLSFSGY